jgi:hypothetical protein
LKINNFLVLFLLYDIKYNVESHPTSHHTCQDPITSINFESGFLELRTDLHRVVNRSHPIYCRQIPGCPSTDPKKALLALVALYGFRQSGFEFYVLISSLLIDLGMTRCDVDHGIFIAEWASPPDLSVTMPTDGGRLVLYVPLHASVDDGLAITNSRSLYLWFLATLSKRLLIVDLGQCSKFL